MRHIFLWICAGVIIAISIGLSFVKTVETDPAISMQIKSIEYPLVKASPATYLLGACESGNRDLVCHVDSNGKESCGRYQYQWGTWHNFEIESGITGSPLNERDSTLMTNWALEHEKGPIHWVTCYKKIKNSLSSPAT